MGIMSDLEVKPGKLHFESVILIEEIMEKSCDIFGHQFLICKKEMVISCAL